MFGKPIATDGRNGRQRWRLFCVPHILPGKQSHRGRDGVAKFTYGIGPGGVYLVPTLGMPGQLCPGCMTEEEVDEQIQRLKDELDDVAWQMKKAIHDRGPSLLPKRS